MAKCLILYSSLSGNTEKVAHRIRGAFRQNGWECDMFKIVKGFDLWHPPFDFDNYDFLCVGSPTIMALPTQEVVELMRQHSRKKSGMRKVEPGPRGAIAFATYGGAHLGPREADACLALLEIEIEHLGFKSVGRFCCPGKYVDYATPEWYHGDIRARPNAQDLQKAADFVQDVLQSGQVQVA